MNVRHGPCIDLYSVQPRTFRKLPGQYGHGVLFTRSLMTPTTMKTTPKKTVDGPGITFPEDQIWPTPLRIPMIERRMNPYPRIVFCRERFSWLIHRCLIFRIA